MAAGRSWRDAGGTATVALVLLYASAALSALVALLAWLRGLDPFAATAPEAMLWLVQLILYAAAFIVTLRWIYLANNNARARGADDMIVSPGWAVGWFFVPLLNLVMPFIAMRELWKASSNPRDWQVAATPVLIPLWWGFWVAAGITGAIGFQMALTLAKTDGSAVETVSFVSDLLSVPALLLLARIVAGVQAMQARVAPDSAEALKDRFA